LKSITRLKVFYIRIILILLLLADLLVWIAAQGSGHIIPAKTNYSLLIVAAILLVLTVVETRMIGPLKSKSIE
jgi:hypothetical protein